jgi:Skp family chaperone for outer membrane proteins
MSRIVLSVLFAAFWTPLLCVAQTPAGAPTASVSTAIPAARLAWMNLEQAIFSCDEGKKEFAEVQKFVDGKNAELESLRKEAENLRNQLNVQGSKLTDEARLDLESQVDAKETNLQRFQQDTQKEIDNRRVRATNYIGKRLLPVIEKVSREKGLTAVFYFNSSRDAWVDPTTNITEEVVKAYNATYAASAPKIPASAPAAKP